VMLAGDAGGFVNGFTAEGIYYAMVSGELAGRSAIDGRPSHFERAWKREIGAELRDSVIVQRFLFRNAARIDAMVRGARVHSRQALTLVDYAMGRIDYKTARARFLARFPLSAFSIILDFLLSWTAWDN
jgi:flavin-dependent dehydrogenase